MVKHYIKVAIRNLVRLKNFSLINLLGLSIAFTVASFILLHTIYELSYDRFIPDHENVYRSWINYKAAGKDMELALVMTPLGPALQEQSPSVLSYTRINMLKDKVFLSVDNNKFYQDGWIYADSGFFDTFGLRLLKGNRETALSDPYSVIITPDVAKKFFGSEDPLGKAIRVNNNKEYTITGIIEEMPSNSHFEFKMAASFSTMYKNRDPRWMNIWSGDINYYLYLRLNPGTDPGEIKALANQIIGENTEEARDQYGFDIIGHLQPVTSIHLHSHLLAEIKPNSDISRVYTFLAIAFFILVIASINFMNLTTARSSTRLVEVGIRKVTGGGRNKLILQFIGEAVILCLLSLLIAFVLVELLMPVYNRLAGQQIPVSVWHSPLLIIGLFILATITGILAGSYPALYLSSFNPADVLKGGGKNGKSNSVFRNLLVILQFTISVAMIISTIIIYKQLLYMQQKDLGLNKEQVLVASIRSDEMHEKYKTFKDNLSSVPGVISVSASQNYPGNSFSFNGYLFENVNDKEPIIMASIDVDEDFANVLDLQVLKGRNFSKDFTTDNQSALVNETALKIIGYDDPLGKKIDFYGDKVTLIGVVKDFNFESLHDNVKPVVITFRENRFRYFLIRVSPADIPVTIRNIKNTWKKFEPEKPMDYFFLDDTYDAFYKSERRMTGLMLGFTFFAIFIASLGLFGLSSFIMERKRKEIGIRKAIGASLKTLLWKLSRGFIGWVLLSVILGSVCAWFLMNEYLTNFAYVIEIPLWAFAVTGVVTLFIALLTMSYQVVKAVKANPVDSLRYE
ncbi:MAG: ABC transporter permease [Bacteroidota bacterium]